jgi:hypothetical protein
MRRGEGNPSPAFDYSGVHLYIGTPSRGQCTMNFAVSMAQTFSSLVQLGVNVSWVVGQNDCFPDWSRNKMLADFLDSSCTHIWLCDDDMGWDIFAVEKMLAKNVDFIAGAGPKKQDHPEFAVRHYTNAHFSPTGDHRPYVRDGLIRCTEIGGAFMIIKRVAIERMVCAYPELRCAQVHEKHGYSLFQTLYERHDFHGEDYLFCRRWTDIGGEIWCYPDVSFTHAGSRLWEGNYHQFLKGLRKPAAQGAAPAPPPPSDLIPPALASEKIDQIIGRMLEIAQAADERKPA